MKCESITREIIGAAIEVHRALGPGLLESSYLRCLCHELGLRGVKYVCEHPVSLTYNSVSLDAGYRLDLFVEGQVVVEAKAVESLLPIHEAQLLTYMRLTSATVGLLFNFHAIKLTDTMIRRVL